MNRRTLLKAGAWAAPAVVLVAAAPAWAASTDPVTIAMLTVTSTGLTPAAGSVGPLTWAGGKIKYTGTATSLPTATIPWIAKISGPGIAPAGVTIASGTAVITKGTTFTAPSTIYGTASLAPGVYTVTFTASASNGPTSATSTATVVAATGATSAVIADLTGNRFQVTVTFTGNVPIVASAVTASISTTGAGTWDSTGFSGSASPQGALSKTVSAGNVLTVVFPAWKKKTDKTVATSTVSVTVPGYPAAFTSGPTTF